MLLFPAIDVRGGRCVRLYQGDFAVETSYAEDPAGVAASFAAAGARRLHVVDLDAARTGELTNLTQVAEIVAAAGVPVQYGGGVRSVEAAARLADAGVARVVIGTAALENPSLVAEIAARQPVALGLDVRGREVAVRGWQAAGGRSFAEVLASAPEADAVVVTQISTDGTLGGPDMELLAETLAATEIPVVASGGVGTLEDLLGLADLRAGGRALAGAIVGRAIYERTVDLAEALAILAETTATHSARRGAGGDGEGGRS
ncbi:MAG: 1-(5-phosphoribosyl)-5-((5-phosphoribosylamino)methylideneamino)imidazole-4-carboxamide isomerase [Acidimicrobiia bacterium]|nr:1-(5-phosphoribosyl)-5-((5-phosphoribosylamino)methylideneamino)imidazole-4-carboxamide isomerase [Acidimicrobiia bacterium]MYC46546.1 1-(5-phosphoribosyl)-5-((5-phosphoribosylamino)methylideneamino)imidazole-4-carboxamide isomerase [Acidimicrobiia bacterium]MYI19224.1 1-(5-phosphoribosyl)-5-((5-phosphoribosylamino)methylideneamino)imidazole-4-carboxamide isomerase [Acidimicrobiia bacterium]